MIPVPVEVEFDSELLGHEANPVLDERPPLT